MTLPMPKAMLALVWVNPLQTRAEAMADALDTLATFAYEGPDWPYILIQLYEGANHMPLWRISILVF